LSEWVVLGVVIGGTELVLRVIDYLSSRKTRNLGLSKKNPRHKKVVKTDREKTEKN
jgi:hypothetical protein